MDLDLNEWKARADGERGNHISEIENLQTQNKNSKEELLKLYDLQDARKLEIKKRDMEITETNKKLQEVQDQNVKNAQEAYQSFENYQLMKQEMEEITASRDDFKARAERNARQLT